MKKIVFSCLLFSSLLFAIENNHPTSQQDLVYLNKKSLIYHEIWCSNAQRCTKNCTLTSRTQAIYSGARHYSKCL